MSTVFPPRSREYFKIALFVLAAVGALAAAGIAYYVTPAYTRVGYEPLQPISFSHKLHVGGLGMECLHCHNHVGDSPHANVPSTQTCLNCHGTRFGNVAGQSAALAPLRAAELSGRALEWARVHKVPDYAYFNHAVHVRRGVSCVSCHGRIDEMDVVRHEQPLSMSWCLDCHRNPGPNLRPASKVFDLGWTPNSKEEQEKFANDLIRNAGIHPPQNCSGCHR
ncbi:MAG: cytochrome c3 family protein [Planctomycetota bacterium]